VLVHAGAGLRSSGVRWRFSVSGISTTKITATTLSPAPAAKAQSKSSASTRKPATRGPITAPKSDIIWKVATTIPPLRPPMTSPTTAAGAEPRKAAEKPWIAMARRNKVVARTAWVPTPLTR